jgi:serine/threonine protein kinase
MTKVCVLVKQAEEGKLHRVKELHRMPLEEVVEKKLDHVNPEARREFSSLLRAMLRFDPKDRAVAADLLKYPWLGTAETE